MKIDFFFRNTAKSDDTSSSKDVREFLFPLFFSFLLETREKWERTGIRKRILGCLKSKANSLDHGASDGVVRFHGFFELAAGFFHGHGNVDRSFLTFRARLTIVFFFFQPPLEGSPFFG